MRKVVSKRTSRPGGSWFPYFYAKLECGHEVLHETGARDPKSKRCKECERDGGEVG